MTTEKKSPRKSAAKKSTAAKSKIHVLTASEPALPNIDDVRRRAYELYEERGRVEGYHEEDWRRAEEELRNGKLKSA